MKIRTVLVLSKKVFFTLFAVVFFIVFCCCFVSFDLSHSVHYSIKKIPSVRLVIVVITCVVVNCHELLSFVKVGVAGPVVIMSENNSAEIATLTCHM